MIQFYTKSSTNFPTHPSQNSP